MQMKRLPDAEFAIMKAVWSSEPPMTTNEIIGKLDEGLGWKPSTVLTLLMRLVDRGFLTSERQGRERCFSPAVEEEAYLQFETDHFIRKFYKNSVANLVSAMYEGKKMTDEEIGQLSSILHGGKGPDKD